MPKVLRTLAETLLVLLLVAVVLTSCNSAGPHLVVPLPEVSNYSELNLLSLNATSPSHVFVAGFLVQKGGAVEACMLTTRNAGKSWRRVGADTHDFTGFLPQDIQFNDRLNGWVSGIRIIDGATVPMVIRTDDGGGHWRESFLAQDRTGIVLGVRDLQFDSDEIGRVSIHYVEADGQKELVNVFSTKDGGRNWVVSELLDDIPAPRDTAERMVSSDQGFRLIPADATSPHRIVFTADGGRHWVPFATFRLEDLQSWY